jgi:hypothetical protein
MQMLRNRYQIEMTAMWCTAKFHGARGQSATTVIFSGRDAVMQVLPWPCSAVWSVLCRAPQNANIAASRRHLMYCTPVPLKPCQTPTRLISRYSCPLHRNFLYPIPSHSPFCASARIWILKSCASRPLTSSYWCVPAA